MAIKNGLAYLPITKPTAEEIATLPQVVAFGSENWDPTKINDYDDEWIATPDKEGLHDTTTHLHD